MSSIRRRLWHTIHQLQNSWALRRCAIAGSHVRVIGEVWIHGNGAIHLGDRVWLDGRSAPLELHALDGGELFIGDDTCIEGGSSIEVCQRVSIGAGCVVGAFSKIIDNHFHAVSASRHDRPASIPVVIGDGVQLGRRVVVLPGTHIEAGMTVGPGQVLRRRPTPALGTIRFA